MRVSGVVVLSPHPWGMAVTGRRPCRGEGSLSPGQEVDKSCLNAAKADKGEDLDEYLEDQANVVALDRADLPLLALTMTSLPLQEGWSTKQNQIV